MKIILAIPYSTKLKKSYVACGAIAWQSLAPFLQNYGWRCSSIILKSWHVAYTDTKCNRGVWGEGIKEEHARKTTRDSSIWLKSLGSSLRNSCVYGGGGWGGVGVLVDDLRNTKLLFDLMWHDIWGETSVLEWGSWSFAHMSYQASTSCFHTLVTLVSGAFSSVFLNYYLSSWEMCWVQYTIVMHRCTYKYRYHVQHAIIFTQNTFSWMHF